MSDLRELLERVVPALHQAGVPFMIAGSFASAAQGLPRATQDLDIVIDPSGKTLNGLLDLLPPESYYVDVDVAREAFGSHGMFNVIVPGPLTTDACCGTTEPPETIRGRPLGFPGQTSL